MSWTHSRRANVIAGFLILAILPILGLQFLRAADPRRYAARAAAGGDLRHLSELQAKHLQEHHRYAFELGTLGFRSSDGVEVRMVADFDSWAATAGYHHGSGWMPVDIDCSIRVGRVAESWGPIDLTTLPDGLVTCQ